MLIKLSKMIKTGGDKMKLCIIFICILGMLTGLVGCGVIQSVIDTVVGKPEQNISTTPEQSMYQAVKSSNWLVTASIIGIAVSTFAFINGSKVGLAGIVSCCISLFATLAVARFATWMAVCGLVGAVLICTYSILIKNRAVKELVTGAQELKEINGNSKLGSKVLFDVQSVSTRKIVNRIKDALKLQGKM